MKKSITLLVIMVAVITEATAQKIKGSDTMLPLTQKTAEAFMNHQTGRNVMVTGGGSGVGISALFTGTTDIAMSSRKIKLEEVIKLKESVTSFNEVIVAYDALTVVVNPKNPISKLTREQLEAIFTGKITNWKSVGGKDMKIIVYSRESSSGTYEFFKDKVLMKKNYMSAVLSLPATGAIVQSISQTEGAIGYIGLAYLDKSLKGLQISYDKGKSYVTPTLQNAINKTYPIVRPLYYYYLTKNEKIIKPFIDYILSKEGQKIISNMGYVPIN